MVQSGHEPVARAGTQVGREVQPGTDRDDQDPGEELQELEWHLGRCGQHHQANVRGGPDQHDVQERPDPRPLPKGQPQQEDRDAQRDADRPERNAQVVPEPLVERLPRTQAESGAGHARDPDPEADDPHQQSRQATQDDGRLPALAHRPMVGASRGRRVAVAHSAS